MSHSVIDTPRLGDKINRYGPSSARNKADSPARLESKTVDIHAHVVIPKAAEYMAPHFDPMRIAMVKHANDYTRKVNVQQDNCLLYTSPSPRDRQKSRMPSSA